MEIRFDPCLLKALEKKEREEENKTTQEKEFIRLCIKYRLCPKCHIGMIKETDILPEVNYIILKCSKCNSSYKVIKHVISKIEEKII